MKKMKKKLIAAVIVFGALTVSAQTDNATNSNQNNKKSINKSQRPDANARATKMTNQMAKKLFLTEDQKPKIQAINLDKAKKIDALRGITDKSKKELMAYRKTIEQERDNDLKNVLTLDQYEKWHQWKDEKKEELKKKMQNKKAKNKEEGVSESEVMDNMEN
jgi:Spy/CpxP family protein refolding chaperone